MVLVLRQYLTENGFVFSSAKLAEDLSAAVPEGSRVIEIESQEFSDLRRAEGLAAPHPVSGEDLVWLFYWGSEWGLIDGGWSAGVKHFVYGLSVINFFVKLGAIVMVMLTEKDNIRNTLPDAFNKMLPPN